MRQKTVSKTRSLTDTFKDVIPKIDTLDPSLINRFNSWEFKISGRGTSGWMSWVKEAGKWVQLRPSNTSFVSAIAALEPEIMRLAFPHKVTERRVK